MDDSEAHKSIPKSPTRPAAIPRLTRYPGWHIGSGLERINDPNADPLTIERVNGFDSASEPFVIDWLLGLKLIMYPRDETCRVVYTTGLFEPNEFFYLDEILAEGMVFVDVGANLGLYSLFASRKVGTKGRVLAIEPSSREYDRLVTNCRLNAVSNLTPLKLALSDFSGSSDLLVASSDHAGHNTLGKFGYEGIVLDRKETVRVETLDNIISQRTIQRVDVIKMDVEGSELLALKGGVETIRRFKPILLVEVSDRTLKNRGCSSEMVLSFLDHAGYRILGFGADGRLGPPTMDFKDSQNIVAIHRESRSKD